jgi:hypothetical protein
MASGAGSPWAQNQSMGISDVDFNFLRNFIHKQVKHDRSGCYRRSVQYEKAG